MVRTSDILFFDLEVHKKSKRILEIGALLRGDQFRRKSVESFVQFADAAKLLCGHNIMDHDLPILKKYLEGQALFAKSTIDTLYWSALLFPKKPYHRLVKDYHLHGDELNNPLADAKLTRELLLDLLDAYQKLPENKKVIYYSLLIEQPGFTGFFELINEKERPKILTKQLLVSLLQNQYSSLFCGRADLEELIERFPVELAYAIALITTHDPESLPPAWILHHFPSVTEVINRLRIYCDGRGSCAYCQHLQPRSGLQKWFGFPGFRHFEGDGEQPLQKQVVEAALAGKSLIAIFPTGGGKSLTFQLPALMQGDANRSLTVIISPLQSLMKDQVDVLEKRHGITAAVTINGMLSPLERTEAMERVAQGGANLLYISPESLRSKSIINLLKGRLINRFVIDEAHCLSAWGQDFRVDYLYIGRFIKKLQEEKNLSQAIPVSCFTATAKPAVVEDIQNYFKEHLELELELFQTSAKRRNLQYFVFAANGLQEKLEKLIELLQSEEGPKIVYVSRVKTAEDLAEKLLTNGFPAKAYHGQLDRDVKKKIQEEFMEEGSELEVIVATSAFGMGVDKDNVKMVVHYQISDSLENYMQESGRAGRNPELRAKCFILFDENDLSGHFNLLNTSKLNFKEINQIWQGIKQFRKKTFTKSALEIAKAAGWDSEMYQLETRVKTAISALEESGYVRREENAPRIFASSIVVKNVEQANQRIDARSDLFESSSDIDQAKRIFGSLISRARTEEDTRIDSMAEALGIDRNEISRHLTLFKQIGVLSNDKDLTAYYFTVSGKRHSTSVFKQASLVEAKMFELLFPTEEIWTKTFYLRELNESLIEAGQNGGLHTIKTVLNYWSVSNSIYKERIDRTTEQYQIKLRKRHEILEKEIRQRKKMGEFCLAVIERDYVPKAKMDQDFNDKKLIEFSTLEIQEKVNTLLGEKRTIPEYEYLLLYLHRLNVIELKSGLLVFYNPMKIVRHQENNRKKYTLDDFEQLARYYQSKTEQIHIVGEYAKKRLRQQEEALQFVDDYFVLDYNDFLSKYFPGRRTKIRQALTEEQFERIIKDLSPEQLEVVKDNNSQNILVAAGPGSGKTRVLVHKVAHLLLLEDIKPEQFLMLTFSRPAALEFKTRLRKLVGRMAFDVDIFTYHGFAFQLQGRMGDLERSENVLQEITEAIKNREVSLDRLLSKSVMVVDEFQDVSQDEYEFIEAIAEMAGSIRVIVVGDDDQNIYEFRGASIKYMREFAERYAAKTYYLTANYRARRNLLEFSNRFLKDQITSARVKKDVELVAIQKENGKIGIIHHQHDQLILPLLEQIKQTELHGTTCVLTHSNEEAVLMTTLLNQEGLPARLIVHKEGFALRDMLEVRWFTHIRSLQRFRTGRGWLQKKPGGKQKQT
jgi:ATP-dependent DNA helicase RecQ